MYLSTDFQNFARVSICKGLAKVTFSETTSFAPLAARGSGKISMLGYAQPFKTELTLLVGKNVGMG